MCHPCAVLMCHQRVSGYATTKVRILRLAESLQASIALAYASRADCAVQCAVQCEQEEKKMQPLLERQPEMVLSPTSVFRTAEKRTGRLGQDRASSRASKLQNCAHKGRRLALLPGGLEPLRRYLKTLKQPNPSVNRNPWVTFQRILTGLTLLALRASQAISSISQSARDNCSFKTM